MSQASSKLEVGGSSAAELFTPEAMRRSASSGQLTSGKPGEKTPSKSGSKKRRSDTSKSPSKMRLRIRRCGRVLSFVPWWALLSLALLVGGLGVTAIKGRPAAEAATALLEELYSDTKTGFPLYINIFETSVWAMVGVAGAATALVLLIAGVRLDQKLRKAGKYQKAKGSYGAIMFKFYRFLSWVGVVLTVLLALWTAVCGVMLASWASQCWNLQKGTGVATANIAALSTFKTQLNQAVDNAAAAVSGASGTKPAVQQPTTPAATTPVAAPATPAPATPAPATPALSTNTTTASPDGVVSSMTSGPARNVTSTNGTVSGQSAAVAPPSNTNKTAATLNNVDTAMPAALTAVDSMTAQVLAIKQYAQNFSELSVPNIVWQDNGLCPSAACLNLAMYPFTESTSCICKSTNVERVQGLAKASYDAALWAFIGVAGLFVGSLFGSMELAADAAMLNADQLFLRVIKRKSRSSRSSPQKREGQSSSFSRNQMLATPQHMMLSPDALPMHAPSTTFHVSAHA